MATMTLLSTILLLVIFSIFGCQAISGAVGGSLFCGKELPGYHEVGESLKLSAALLASGIEPSEVVATWTRTSNGIKDEITSCNISLCTNISHYAENANMTYENATAIWSSTIMLNPLQEHDIGIWGVKWSYLFSPLTSEICRVNVKPIAAKMDCPMSSVGYPLTLTATSSNFSMDVREIRWYRETKPVRTMVANCSIRECTFSEGLSVVAATSSVTDNFLVQSVLTVVGDISINLTRWTAEWNYTKDIIESTSCFALLENPDPYSDCLEPIVIQPSNNLGLNEPVLVTLMCFSRTIKRIVVTGNYSEVLELTEPCLYSDEASQCKFKVIRSYPSSIAEIYLSAFFDDTHDDSYFLRIHINSSYQAPVFQSSFYAFNKTKDSPQYMEFPLMIDRPSSNYSLNITRAFPIPIEQTGEFIESKQGYFHFMTRDNSFFSLISVFEYKFLFKATDLTNGESTYGVVIFYPGYKENKYRLHCESETSYELHPNASTNILVPLPCIIYDTRNLQILFLKNAEHLQVRAHDSNIQLELDAPFPIGISNDVANISVVDAVDNSIIVPSIQLNFEIKQIPPTPLILNITTEPYSARIFIQLAPTQSLLSELMDKNVIISFSVEIWFDGTTITPENVDIYDGMAVYHVEGLNRSTEYIGRVFIHGFNANVTSEPFTFMTQDAFPKPVLQDVKTMSHSAEIHIKVAPTIERMSELMTNGVIKFFFLEIKHEGTVINPEKYANVSDLPDDIGTIAYSVRGLESFTEYTGLFITVGSGANISTGLFKFKTLMGIEIPVVHSSQPGIVALDDKLYLNCSSNVTGIHFKWYHEGMLLKEENENQLKLIARNNTAGIYRCQINKENVSSLSEEYPLTVLRSEDISEYTPTTSIILQKQWIPELGDTSSPQFFAMKVYLERMIEFAMYRRQNFVKSNVIYFRRGSIVAETEVVERVINRGETTDLVSYLQTQLNSSIAESFQLDEINLQLSGIELKVGNTQLIQEGSPVEINCQFVIVHSTKPLFELEWIYNHSIINQERATTFTFEHKLSILSKQDGWLDLGSTNVYHYNYKLKIQQFPPRLIGTFSCEIELKMPDIPPDIIDMNKTQSLNITYNQILRQPKVLIHPPSIQVQDPSVNINVSCNYSYADTVYLLNDMDKVIASKQHLPPIGIAHFHISSSEKSVRCLAKSLTTLQTESDLCDIQVIKPDIKLCKASEDAKGELWEEGAAGTTSVKYCPQGYSGTITRKCSENGRWEESNYIKCIKEELKTVKEEIENINGDGFVATTQQIKDISETVNSSVTGAAPVLSGDIVQLVSILGEVGKAVTVEGEDEQGNLVDSETLDNFASAANALISTDDSEWEAIKNADVEGTGNEETSGVGSKLVVAMDLVATASLSNTTLSTEPIVKKSIAIKRDKFTNDNIVFPLENEEGYDKFDNWVSESKSKAFLSAQNFDEVKEEIQYAIVLFRGVDSKFVVQNDEQEKYSSTKNLREKEVASYIMSFSLSTDVSSFNYPLKMEFQITKVNHTKPQCGFLDTSLGSQPVWSNKGCKTAQIKPDIVECQCSHLTNFAILMSPYGTSEEHHEILSIVTYAGCGVSILCLVVTIVMHAITWKYVKEDRSILHIHLSVVLILAYIAFLAGINQTDHDIRCTIIAALLHYLFLTVFFIMLAEGIQVLVTVSFVFSKKSYLWRLLIMAYVCPLVVVGTCLAISITKTDGYRSSDLYAYLLFNDCLTPQSCQCGYGRTISSSCWLDVDSGFLWGFVGPALFVVLVNFIIMIATLIIMMNTVSMQAKPVKARAKSAIRAIVVLSPIFGTTWVFGVFSVNESLVTFQYLFAVFNCLQGLFVFLFYCLFCNQIKDGLRHMLRKYRSRSFGTEERMFFSSENQNSENASKLRKQSVDNVSNSNNSSDDPRQNGFSDVVSPNSGLVSSIRPLDNNMPQQNNNFDRANNPYSPRSVNQIAIKGREPGITNRGFHGNRRNNWESNSRLDQQLRNSSHDLFWKNERTRSVFPSTSAPHNTASSMVQSNEREKIYY